jgi:hypothetical protein
MSPCTGADPASPAPAAPEPANAARTPKPRALAYRPTLRDSGLRLAIRGGYDVIHGGTWLLAGAAETKARWRVLEAARQLLRALVRGGPATGGGAGIAAAVNPAVAAYRDEVLTRFPYTPEARHWLRTAIGFEVQDLASTRGGGYWYPDANKVFLFTAQYEAAIHELAHAWWHYRRQGQEAALIEATIALSRESDPRYARLQGLAYGYIHGIPEQHWAGMLVERNDWEMYASMASGMMADLRLVPPYLHPFYDGMYQLLPDGAPSPIALAPHG